MRVDQKPAPRVYRCGAGNSIEMKDCASIALDADEQVTFRTESGAEYDVARKSWGFYATPSTNKRLKSFCLRAAVVENSAGAVYINLCESGKEDDFFQYLVSESSRVICWLDDEADLARLRQAFQPNGEKK